MFQDHIKLDERELNRSVLDQMKQALCAFERTLPQLKFEQQSIFNELSSAATQKLTADIRQVLGQRDDIGTDTVTMIASYVCRLTFLSAACKSVGKYDCFLDIQHQYFKTLIDLPLSYNWVRCQTQEMQEMWRAELRKWLSHEMHRHALAS